MAELDGRRRRRRTGAVLGGALVSAALLLSACGGDSSEPATDAASPDPSTASESAAPVWNPCDGLDAVGVGEALGGAVTEDDGEPAAPRCAFTPVEEGGPALNATYMDFPPGLDAAWETMGNVAGAELDLAVPGADAGRMVVKAADGSLLITGFVQNGDLIQVVNLVQPSPYDRAVAVSGVRTVLADLSANAATWDSA